jgi:hypothetical protein
MFGDETDVVGRLALGLGHEMGVDIPKSGHKEGNRNCSVWLRGIFLRQVLLLAKLGDDVVVDYQGALRQGLAGGRDRVIGLDDGIVMLLVRGYVALSVRRLGASSSSDDEANQENASSFTAVLVSRIRRHG